MPSFTVRTNCEFSLSIEADNADAAIEQAQKKLHPPHLALAYGAHRREDRRPAD